MQIHRIIDILSELCRLAHVLLIKDLVDRTIAATRLLTLLLFFVSTFFARFLKTGSFWAISTAITAIADEKR